MIVGTLYTIELLLRHLPKLKYVLVLVSSPLHKPHVTPGFSSESVQGVLIHDGLDFSRVLCIFIGLTNQV